MGWEVGVRGGLRGESGMGEGEATLCNAAAAIVSGGNEEVKLIHLDNRLLSRFSQQSRSEISRQSRGLGPRVQ